MKKFTLFCLFCFLCILFSCTKDRNIGPGTENPSVQPLQQGDIMINEYVAKGSVNPDEFGVNSDWIELYNTRDYDIVLESNLFYISDDSGTPDKFMISGKTIPAKGFLLVWCNSATQPGTQLNAPFGLSSTGEQLGVYYKNSDGTFLALDSLSYGEQNLDAVSNARVPDGSPNWTILTTATPGENNN